MLFSPGSGGFYDRAIHTEIPADAVEVPSHTYHTLLQAQTKGAQIVWDEVSQMPVARLPVADVASLLTLARQQIDRLHAQALERAAGGATPQEQATWVLKANAARNLLDGIASADETALLKREAGGRDVRAAELARVIFAKHQDFLSAVAEASAARAVAKRALAHLSKNISETAARAAITSALTEMANSLDLAPPSMGDKA
ncbi:MAG: hypothetical protein AAGF71_06125 [Pseudomonadota bacterium]